MSGVRIGLRDVHYAILNDGTDTVSIAPVYQAPVKMTGAVSATVTPGSSSDTFFGDDSAMDNVTSLGEIEVEISVGQLPLSVVAALLGYTLSAAGTIKKTTSAVAPWVALGFKSLKSNGSYRYVWLLKGKFQEPEDSYETKGESVTFQPATLKGTFVKREYDDAWQILGDADAVGWLAATGTNWFVQVDPVGGVATIELASIAKMTGDLGSGDVMTAGALTPTAATVTYQWQICATAGGVYDDIVGETNATYTIVAGVVDKFLRVKAVGSGNYTGTVYSAIEGPVTA